jgi:glucoamylase
MTSDTMASPSPSSTICRKVVPSQSTTSLGREKKLNGFWNFQTFWNEKEGFMTETTITDVKTGGRSGVGAVPMTASILNFDPTLGCDPHTFQPCSDRALSNLKVVGDKFTEIFPINKRLPPNQFPYVGFFLEDKLYDGQVRAS